MLVSRLPRVSLLQDNVRCSPRQGGASSRLVGRVSGVQRLCLPKVLPFECRLLNCSPFPQGTAFSEGIWDQAEVIQIVWGVVLTLWWGSLPLLPVVERKLAWRHSHMAGTSSPPNQEEGDKNKKIGLLGISVYLSTARNSQEGQNSQFHLGSEWPKYSTPPHHLTKKGKAKFLAQPCTPLSQKTDHRTTS